MKYGIIGGAILSIYLIALYFVDKNLLTQSLTAYWLPLLLIHPAAMYLSARQRQAEPPGAEFRERVRLPFQTFAIANVFFWIALYALHLADPELARMELQQQLVFVQGQLEQGVGDPQQMNELRQQLNDIQAEINKPVVQQPAGPYVFSLAIWNIFGFGIAAAITAVLPKK